MSKTAVLLSCSDHYQHRLYLWDRCLQAMGFETQYVTGNFDHMKKDYFTCNVPNCVQLSVLPYKKNLSAQRILSHRMFAKKAKLFLEQTAPDLVVAILPPNFLGKYLAQYKKQHPNVVLLFDIFDLWPETFPSGKVKKLLAPVFSIWASLRDRSLPKADFVTTECNLFQKKLQLTEEHSKTIYLCSLPHNDYSVNALSIEERLELCYLGSINNVISIPDICSLISSVSSIKPVTLHIIGKGERLEELIESAKSAGADVVYHGVVYDAGKKAEIMSQCHFGLNIMKASVCVGLTMKSVDYFSYGLPIINNIGSDTTTLVLEDGVGIQLQEDCAAKLLDMNKQEYAKYQENVIKCFNRYFSEETVEKQLDEVLKNVLK